MEHQHFIPRCYLKNFSVSRKGKPFVSVYDVESKKEFERTTKGICVKSGLYTIKHHPDDPYALEKYYAENVDSVYPKIYELLITPSVTTISISKKRLILNTLLSLYFRTPKVLDSINKLTDDLIQKSLAITNEDQIKIQFENGEPFSFNRSDAEKIKIELREANRMTFLEKQFKTWKQFVMHKEKAGISVYKVIGNVPLITCDNPVTIRNSTNENFSLWDIENIIQVPLDSDHFVFIMPNSEPGDPLRIYRGRREEHFAITTNHDCLQNASKWLIGKPGNIEKAVSAINHFNSKAPDVMNTFSQLKAKAFGLQEFLELCKKFGPLNPIVIKKLREMNRDNLYATDPAFHDILDSYTKKGVNIT